MILVILITLLSLLTFYSAENCQTANCAQCNGSSECDSCNDGYYLEAGACKRCPLQCSQCIHASVCQSCVKEYWNPGVQCTSPCSIGCDRDGCDDNGYCNECYLRKYGPRCDQDCTLCRNGECDLYKCTQGCKDGYLLSDTGSGYSDCYPCPNNCTTCSNTTYCTECEQGFYASYYRTPPTTGRGFMSCIQCEAECTQCTPPDQCPQWCKSECIKRGCEPTGICVTTPSTSHTTTLLKRSTRLNTREVTQTTANHTACPSECMNDCDAHGKCLDITTTSYTTFGSSSGLNTENNYYEGFGHGIGTGIGIIVAVGALIGFIVFLTRRTKCFHTMCRTKSSTDTREQHEYVNTQLHASTQSASNDRREYDDVEANAGIRVTALEPDVDADREYTSIGERKPEHHYSDLQRN